jgi:hypothetical protein
LATTEQMVSSIMKSPAKKDEVAKKIMTRQRNLSWLVANYDKLRPDYKNNFVAVHRRKVVAYAPDLEELTRKLKEMCPDTGIFATALIAEKRPLLILCFF